MANELSVTDVATLLRPAIAAAKTITGVAAAGNVVTVTSAGHGYSVGDVVAIYGVGGAVEANGAWVIATVPLSSTYTLTGITTVTTYTSGGSSKKITGAAGLTPGNLRDLQTTLDRRAYTRGTDADRTAESTIAAIIA